MLVLSRKEGELIRIGHDITIVIVGIRSPKVRVGIVAPEDLPVHREEVYQAIQRDAAKSEIKPSVIDALVSHVTAPDAQKKLDKGWFICLTCGATVHRSDKQHQCYSLPRSH